MSQPLVSARGLGLAIGGRSILRDVDLDLRRGEIVTLVGPNGAGKTTLLRLLLGAAQPSAGRVTRAPGLRVGYVPQRLSIDRTLPLTVDRFLRLAGGDPGARGAALARVGIAGLGGRQMAELSGGQFQRALLARALVREPDLLALDEPTQGLDQPGAAAFYRLVADLRRERGCAVLMVGHDLQVVMGASDRVLCLNGHVCCQGAPHEVASEPAYRALFGEGPIGAFALYAHVHDHDHGEDCAHAPAALPDLAAEAAR